MYIYIIYIYIFNIYIYYIRIYQRGIPWALQANVQFLLRKSDDDDALVAMLRKQLGREERLDVGWDVGWPERAMKHGWEIPKVHGPWALTWNIWEYMGRIEVVDFHGFPMFGYHSSTGQWSRWRRDGPCGWGRWESWGHKVNVMEIPLPEVCACWYFHAPVGQELRSTPPPFKVPSGMLDLWMLAFWGDELTFLRQQNGELQAMAPWEESGVFDDVLRCGHSRNSAEGKEQWGYLEGDMRSIGGVSNLQPDSPRTPWNPWSGAAGEASADHAAAEVQIGMGSPYVGIPKSQDVHGAGRRPCQPAAKMAPFRWGQRCSAEQGSAPMATHIPTGRRGWFSIIPRLVTKKFHSKPCANNNHSPEKDWKRIFKPPNNLCTNKEIVLKKV